MTNLNSWQKRLPVKALTIILLGALLLNGCVTAKRTAYLQEYKDSEYSGEYVPPEDYLIQPNDNIYLNVATPDPRTSAMFNAMGEGGNMGFDEATAQIYSYVVEIDGTVSLPYIGNLFVAGQTIAAAKVLIETELSDYVNDATVTVKLVNNNVTVLGEVSVPGVYPLYKERLNIYQALALAGDVDTYGDRYKVSVIRKTSDGTITKTFDITDKQIIDSEYYYILPNDVVYVAPMKGKFFAIDAFPWTLVFTGITTFILLESYINPD